VSRALRVAFWGGAGLLVYAQAGYPLLLEAAERLRGPRAPEPEPLDGGDVPAVTLVIAAHDEAGVIGAKVADALALDWPRERLQVVVASDGSADATAQAAGAAGADLVLELPRGGKVAAQDAGVRAATGELVAFSDANARWEPGALRALAGAFADPAVGYACGQVTFVNAGGDNQEGLYWRYEMALRARESRLASVTGGNGAIYATRREAYVEMDPVMGHDLSFPFTMVKNGWRAVYVPGARATEKMVPSIDGEFARKRRMMAHAWPIVLRGGLLDPRGYGALYALMIASHRVLRYTAPFVHLGVLAASAALVRSGRSYAAALAAQVALLGAAALAPRVRSRPLLVARYYVLSTAAVAGGLVDWVTRGTPAGWDAPEGTR
jgi:hypothetical protein